MITERNRTPIILGIVAGVLLVAVVIALSIYLTRGAASPNAAVETPASAGQNTPSTAPPAPAESTEPTEPAADPTGVVLSATGFTLRDDAGADVFTYGWGDDATPAVTALTKAFGAEPTQRTEAGNGSSYPDYTVYQWSGFALYDMVATDALPRDEYTQPSYLRYTANTIGDTAITAEFDLEIGAAVDTLDPADEWDRGSGTTRIVFEPERTGFSNGAASYAALADTDGEVVTAILYYYYSGH
ncbi:hypothetical protein [Microbacterium invictum]|uniref:Uncharacterized protein n=1 Tax=Microbacterium invictum TaxID=515415 RepID=A0AA40VNK1_9MICO|nr:hypothetical protein [Microbacterium invictum]MBB4140523.1 hypothetical protein [Microbacterium invictum]